MNFWQRRPIGENLLGALVFVLVWWALDALTRLALGHDAGALTPSRIGLLPLLVATLGLTRLLDRMPAAWVGLGVHRWMGRELLAGTLLGLVTALIAWAPSAIAGTVVVGPTPPLALAIDILLYLILGAALEEIIFRGYLFQRAVETIGPVAATLAASVIFAVLHLQNPSVTALAAVNVFLASVLFSLGYFVTGSLWLPIAAHAAWNVTLALVVGAPVSGLDFGGGLLRTIDGAPPVIGGGAFGPEGGLAATLALMLGAVAILRVPGIALSPYVHATIFRSVYRREAERRDPR